MHADLTPPTIAERLDHAPFTRLHAFAIALCALGFGFDLLEMMLGSALAAVFSSPPHTAAPGQLSLLLSSVFAGAAVGAPLSGWVADRHGRRFTLSGLLLLLCVGSFGAAFSSNIGGVTMWRCVSGLALGGFPPLVITYLTDLLPAGRRGPFMMVTIGIATLGPTAGIFLVRALTPLQPLGLEAWRWGFIAGASGSGLAGILFLLLPESPRWLAARLRMGAADLACLRFERARPLLRVVPPAYAAATTDVAARNRSWPLAAALSFLSPWSTVAFPLLSGAILAQKGFKVADTLLYVGLSTFGPLVGNLLIATVIDRIGRRTAMVACSTGMLAAGTLFVMSTAPVPLIVSSFAFTLLVSMQLSFLNLYLSEQFPTETRGRAVAGAWAMNRIGAALGPLLLIPLLHAEGANTMFAVIAATLLAGVILLVFAPSGAARRTVA
ncbi:MFS transporter [Massilia luteola]|uniref:MFS transporter n=1 Tax=Massilia luteola TaxID=3081751 RepID=UPI002ACBE7BC|nr:MFS transporter [Massilia sp. Gc5]